MVAVVRPSHGVEAIDLPVELKVLGERATLLLQSSDTKGIVGHQWLLAHAISHLDLGLVLLPLEQHAFVAERAVATAGVASLPDLDPGAALNAGGIRQLLRLCSVGVEV